MSNDSEEVKSIAKNLRELYTIVEGLKQSADSLASASELFQRCVGYLVVTDDVLREFLGTVIERLEEIKDEIPSKEELHQITRELEQQRIRDHIRSLQVTISQQYANKDRLTEESAKYGANVPLELTNHIISISVEIDKLKSELGHFRELLQE